MPQTILGDSTLSLPSTQRGDFTCNLMSSALECVINVAIEHYHTSHIIFLVYNIHKVLTFSVYIVYIYMAYYLLKICTIHYVRSQNEMPLA